MLEHRFTGGKDALIKATKAGVNSLIGAGIGTAVGYLMPGGTALGEAGKKALEKGAQSASLGLFSVVGKKAENFAANRSAKSGYHAINSGGSEEEGAEVEVTQGSTTNLQPPSCYSGKDFLYPLQTSRLTKNP